MTEMVEIVVGISGLALSGVMLLLAIVNRRTDLVESRLRELSDQQGSAGTASQGPARPGAADRPRRSDGSWTTNRLVPSSDRDRKQYQSRLIQAGLYQSTALSTYFCARLACMLCPIVVGVLLGYLGLVDSRNSLLAGALLGTAGMILPSIWLDRQIARRHVAMRRALPDLLDLMIVCLESGLSLQGTIQRVSDELRIAHPVLSEELAIVQRDTQLGTSVDSTFRHFAERTGLDAIRPLSTLFREAQRFGSELADALRSYADTLRYQREQFAEEMAQKASIKILFPTMLLILPAVFVVLAGPAAIKIQAAFSKEVVE
jgi:tight adherence protein C